MKNYTHLLNPKQILDPIIAVMIPDVFAKTTLGDWYIAIDLVNVLFFHTYQNEDHKYFTFMWERQEL